MKTTNDVLTDLYKVVSNYTPILSLDGGIFKQTRPNNSTKEDCIIATIAGVGAKFVQDGAVSIRIYYADLLQADTHIENTARATALERILVDLSEVLLSNMEYCFDIRTRAIYTGDVPEIHQHYAILKLNYKLTY